MPSFLKKSFLSAITFFATLGALSVGYATLSTGLTVGNTVSSGSWLSSSAWNKIVNGILELDTRTSAISGIGENIGIGTSAPSSRLHIKGGGGIRIDSADGAKDANISLWTNGWATPRYLIRTSPDVSRDGDFEIIQFDKSTGTELNRITWPYNGPLTVPGGVSMGYEIVNDSRVPWAGATTYNVWCPNGKYLLSASVRTVGGWIEVARDNLYNGVLVLSDRNQFNTQLASWVYTTLICANIR